MSSHITFHDYMYYSTKCANVLRSDRKLGTLLADMHGARESRVTDSLTH